MNAPTILPFCNQLKEYHQPTLDHSIRVAKLSLCIGKSLQLDSSELYELNIASCLHDLGKVKVPIQLLNKPTALATNEWLIMKRHPVDAVSLLQEQKYQLTKKVCGGILYHHEHFNGTGYPAGLRGENIPLFGRIIALADAVDAMLHPRPYKKTLSIENTVDEVFRCINTQFDPYIVKRTIASQAALLIGV